MNAASPHGDEGPMFLNADETRTLDAVTARVMPSEPDGRGAREACVVTYIDRAVAGYFRDLQGIYRVGLQRLDDCCRAGFGRAFADLTSAQQDEALLAVEGAWDQPVSPEAKAMLAADRRESILPRFFAIVREHTIQGMFCDPLYGGNRDFTGWKLIGFPGAQWGYTAEQMREGFDATTIPILSLSDLQSTRTGSSHD
jgi:gluconate 2-dehydrogenase gamma chain